ncbi:YidB family protein [Ancylobacter terrae]|uniref:YidB family protein n=1 Tax=Ancylobacter sp. sgz301288 TaxID=3342077 RepID=UPI003859C4C5
MGLFDDAVPGGNIAKPIMIALGALLVSKMLAGKSEPEAQPQAPAEPAPRAPLPQTADADGGLLGGLGGLLDKLRTGGLADAADSWVGTGQNKPVQPGQLGSAIGQQTISELARKAGVSEQELLDQLARVLPGLVDKMTPDGRVPDLRQVASLFQSR